MYHRFFLVYLKENNFFLQFFNLKFLYNIFTIIRLNDILIFYVSLSDYMIQNLLYFLKFSVKLKSDKQIKMKKGNLPF